MVKALQTELDTSCMAQMMPEFELEKRRLQQENEDLQKENGRLLQEINDIKQLYTNQEHQLTRAYCKIQELRMRLNSGPSLGQFVLGLGAVVAIILLLFYATDFIDLSGSSDIMNETAVLERYR